MDPWKVLGLERDATAEQIRARYRTLVREHHPDRFIQGSLEHGEALRNMPEINAAYEVLTKTSARISHEQTMARRRAHAERAREAAGSEPAEAFDYRRRAASEFTPREQDRRDRVTADDFPPMKRRRQPPPPPVEFFAMGKATAPPAKPPAPPPADPPRTRNAPPEQPGRIRRWFKGQ